MSHYDNLAKQRVSTRVLNRERLVSLHANAALHNAQQSMIDAARCTFEQQQKNEQAKRQALLQMQAPARKAQSKARQLVYGQAYRRNKEQINAYGLSHSNTVVANAHQRRARLMGCQHPPYLFSEIIERDQELCGICRQIVDPQERSLDHIIPLSLGGDDSAYNVQLAHKRCNSQKGNRE